MPKFGEMEKVRIRQRLLEEGERLFSMYGLKKVTVDDIVKAVNIAKATFYKFYDGKEYLFLDVVQKQQKEIFDILEGVLMESEMKTDRERVQTVFFSMSELVKKYPLLTGIDNETKEMVVRKIAPERIEEFSAQGFDAVKTIENHGIVFRYDTEVVSNIFHAMYQSWIFLQDQSPEMQSQVIDIMLEGVIQQII